LPNDLNIESEEENWTCSDAVLLLTLLLNISL